MASKMLIERVIDLEALVDSLVPLVARLAERLPAFERHIKAHDKKADRLAFARQQKRAKAEKAAYIAQRGENYKGKSI